MSDATQCSVCGSPVPGDAPGGLCPCCSFDAALAASSPAEPGGAPADDRGGPASFTSAPVSRPSRLPQRPALFGDYELLEEIARGGMGLVYRARQRSLARIVAIKVPLFGAHAAPMAVQRFRAEAVAARALQHPNIVTVHEFGIWEARHFMAMDYVPGQSLSALLNRQALAAKRAARYVQIIAEAIHFAHEHGVLHRDLKPSNILIDRHDQPKVMDFGLAQRLECVSQATLPGHVFGSPSYIPPEQAIGRQSDESRQGDVYALGAILFHALTGRPPFVGESVPSTLELVLKTEPVPPHLLNRGVPSALEAICLKCLEKEPFRRYSVAREVADDLARFQAGKPIHARPARLAGRSWRWRRSRRNRETSRFGSRST